MIELERTFLIKEIPKDLSKCKSIEVIDIYIPDSFEHPTIRIRKNGDKYEVTKKEPVDGNDSSHQTEQTIVITKEEFEWMMKNIKGKFLRKLRYYYNYNGSVAEIDVFKDNLEGLVLVDFEFKTAEDKDKFEMPEFCLADVTQDEFVAGGMLCGKQYDDIVEELNKFGYVKLKV